MLIELDCDVSQMAGSNDGDLLDAKTCQDWANAITSALNADRIYEVRYVDSNYSSGYRTEYHVEGTETPVLVSSEVQVMAIVAEAFRGVTSQPEGLTAEELDAKPIKQVVTLESGGGMWLSEAARFFRTCGGCEQW